MPEASTENLTKPTPPYKSEARVIEEKKAVLPRKDETNIPETSDVVRLRVEALRVLTSRFSVKRVLMNPALAEIVSQMMSPCIISVGIVESQRALSLFICDWTPIADIPTDRKVFRLSYTSERYAWVQRKCPWQ